MSGAFVNSVLTDVEFSVLDAETGKVLNVRGLVGLLHKAFSAEKFDLLSARPYQLDRFTMFMVDIAVTASYCSGKNPEEMSIEDWRVALEAHVAPGSSWDLYNNDIEKAAFFQIGISKEDLKKSEIWTPHIGTITGLIGGKGHYRKDVFQNYTEEDIVFSLVDEQYASINNGMAHPISWRFAKGAYVVASLHTSPQWSVILKERVQMFWAGLLKSKQNTMQPKPLNPVFHGLWCYPTSVEIEPLIKTLTSPFWVDSTRIRRLSHDGKRMLTMRVDIASAFPKRVVSNPKDNRGYFLNPQVILKENKAKGKEDAHELISSYGITAHDIVDAATILLDRSEIDKGNYLLRLSSIQSSSPRIPMNAKRGKPLFMYMAAGMNTMSGNNIKERSFESAILPIPAPASANIALKLFGKNPDAIQEEDRIILTMKKMINDISAIDEIIKFAAYQVLITKPGYSGKAGKSKAAKVQQALKFDFYKRVEKLRVFAFASAIDEGGANSGAWYDHLGSSSYRIVSDLIESLSSNDYEKIIMKATVLDKMFFNLRDYFKENRKHEFKSKNTLPF